MGREGGIEREEKNELFFSFACASSSLLLAPRPRERKSQRNSLSFSLSPLSLVPREEDRDGPRLELPAHGVELARGLLPGLVSFSHAASAAAGRGRSGRREHLGVFEGAAEEVRQDLPEGTVAVHFFVRKKKKKEREKRGKA